MTKRAISILFLCFLLSYTQACQTKIVPNVSVEPAEFTETLQASLAVWERTKARHGDTYQYTTQVDTMDESSSTKVVVHNGVVTERHYHEIRIPECGSPQEISWSETTERELRTHRQGTSVKSMDEWYETCRSNIITRDTSDYDIQLIFRDDGLLQTCTSTLLFCNKLKCTSGIEIATFDFLSDEDLSETAVAESQEPEPKSELGGCVPDGSFR